MQKIPLFSLTTFYFWYAKGLLHAQCELPVPVYLEKLWALV